MKKFLFAAIILILSLQTFVCAQNADNETAGKTLQLVAKEAALKELRIEAIFEENNLIFLRSTAKDEETLKEWINSLEQRWVYTRIVLKKKTKDGGIFTQTIHSQNIEALRDENQ